MAISVNIFEKRNFFFQRMWTYTENMKINSFFFSRIRRATMLLRNKHFKVQINTICLFEISAFYGKLWKTKQLLAAYTYRNPQKCACNYAPTLLNTLTSSAIAIRQQNSYIEKGICLFNDVTYLAQVFSVYCMDAGGMVAERYRYATRRYHP